MNYLGPIKAVIFDFDNTIVDYIRSDIIGLQSLAKLLPANIDEDKFVDVAVEKIHEFHNMVNNGKESPINMHKYRLINTLKHFNINWQEQYLDVYLKNYIQSTSCFEGIEEVLRHLHGKVKLGILTNAYDSEEQRKRIARTNAPKYIDDIIVCCEIETYKPSKEAFLHLVNRYGFKASSCIYIGDSEEYDIKGAKSAGLFTIKVSHRKTVKNDSVADFQCTNFSELLTFFREKNVR